MSDGDNKELIQVLKRMEKQLSDIKDDLADIKRQMPKVLITETCYRIL